MAYPAVATRHPLVWWSCLFPCWWYGTLAVQLWACVRRRPC